MSNTDESISDFCKNKFHAACKWPDCQCECHKSNNNSNLPKKEASYEEAYDNAFGKQNRGELNGP